jgi:hypothetical protein
MMGIYEVNRARSNPAAYGDEIGLSLTGVDPQPPLALNRNLTGSAQFHAVEMLDHDYFSHTSEVTGDGPNTMAVQNGYDLWGQGLGVDHGAANFIESNGWSWKQTPTWKKMVKALVIDEGIPSLGHRKHLLGMLEQYTSHNEIGAGYATRNQVFLYSMHTAYRDTENTFVTGVVFSDRNGNLRYDPGEGIEGATITDGEGLNAESGPSGGYSILVPGGSHTFTCSGGGFSGEAMGIVSVNGSNVALDFHSGVNIGEVDFAFQFGAGIPDGPALSVNHGGVDGTAPFAFNASVSSDQENTVFHWDLGDGITNDGSGGFRLFTEPGLYPVLVTGTSPMGVGSTLEVVSVGDEDGAGESTNDPGSTDIVEKKVIVKSNFRKPGVDLVKLTGSIEMPEGFVPGEHEVQVCVAGAKLEFTIDAKGKGIDENRNKIILKAKLPKGSEAMPAGVIAKLVIKMKGDFADVLGAAGMSDRDFTGTVSDVPFALLLNGLVYRGKADFAVKSKKGKVAKGKSLKFVPLQ